MKLTIDRTVWLRGEGPEPSRLRRESDGKMCCIGIFLKECGVTDAVLTGATTASNVEEHVPPEYREFLINPLHGDRFERDSDIYRLYDTNDDKTLHDHVREERIIDRFANHGIEVEFVG